MRNLAFDSPTESEIAATVRARINRRHNKYRRTMLTTLAAVAAVAAIRDNCLTPAVDRTVREHPTGSTPPRFKPAASRQVLSALPGQASSAPVTTPPTTTANPR